MARKRRSILSRYPLTFGGLIVVAILMACVCWFCAGINFAGGEVIWHRIPTDVGIALWFYLPPAFVIDLFVGTA